MSNRRRPLELIDTQAHAGVLSSGIPCQIHLQVGLGFPAGGEGKGSVSYSTSYLAMS